MDTQQTSPTQGQIQDHYVAKVNALVASDNEHLIADVTADYARLVHPGAGSGEHAAA